MAWPNLPARKSSGALDLRFRILTPVGTQPMKTRLIWLLLGLQSGRDFGLIDLCSIGRFANLHLFRLTSAWSEWSGDWSRFIFHIPFNNFD